MSIEKLAQVMKTPMDDPIAKFVLVVLADHYNDSTGECWPSVETISTITGCSRRTVLRKLKLLEQAGMIARKKRFNKTDLYEIAIGDSLTGVTVSPLGVSGWHTNSYRTLNNKKESKIKIADWMPDDECIQHCKDKGLEPDAIWQAITLWNEQNGNKAAYVSPSAFYKNWCNREADRKPKPRQHTPYQKPSINAVAQRKQFSQDEWDGLSVFMKDWYRQNRPSALPEGVA